MTAAERFASWLDGLGSQWKDRLSGWMIGWASGAVNRFLESNEPEAIDLVKGQLAQVRDHPDTPDELKAVIGKLTEGTKPIPVFILIALGAIMLVPTITAISQPLGRLLEYLQDRRMHTWRLDPAQVMALWRRFPGKHKMLFDDLKDRGWSDARIEALKDATRFFPSPQDLILWQAREVFEPDAVAKYGLDDEFELLKTDLFEKAGVDPEQTRNYWRAHWQHASWGQVVEMLHRGLITEEDVWDWFRLVEVPPYWRDRLIKSAYNVPTRVDVRRFYDLRTIDEARLREIYTAQGYQGKNLDDYVLWTKVYVRLPDLLARWKNGWITLEQVSEELVAAGMKPDAVQELIETKVKSTVSDPVSEGLTLTKGEIYKGVKLGKLSAAEAVELVQDLGYNEATARFLVDINVEVLKGSPETYPDFKALTQAARAGLGLGGRAVPAELRAAANRVVEITRDLEQLERSVREEEAKLVGQDALPAEATERLRELQLTRNRARAELQRLQQEYAAAVAEWRRGGA